MIYIFLIYLLAVVLDFVCSTYLNFSAFDFSLFVVIPIGAILFSLALGYFYYLCIKYKNIFITTKHIIFTVILGFLFSFIVYFMQYEVTYVDDNNYINYTFSGSHISNYELNGEQINYAKYIDFQLNEHDVFVNSHRSVDFEYHQTKIMTIILFILRIMTLSIITPVILLFLTKNANKCNNCKKYYIKKIIIKYNKEDIDNVMTHISDCVNNNKKFLYVSENINENDFYTLSIEFCPICYKGIIYNIRTIKNSNDKFETDKSSSSCFIVENAFPFT